MKQVKWSNWDCESETGVTSNHDCEHETGVTVRTVIVREV